MKIASTLGMFCLLICTFPLAGCTSYYTCNGSRNCSNTKNFNADINNDWLECRALARRLDGGYENSATLVTCMRSKGWPYDEKSW